MASVWKRVRPRPGKPDLVTWECRWRGPDRRQKRKSFARKGDAERYRTEIETRMNNGSYVDPGRSRQSVGAFAERWLTGRKVSVKPKTLAGYRSLLDNWVLPRWGEIPLGDVHYEDVVEWVTELSGKLSPSRTRQAYFLLTSMLDDAVKGRRLTSNPASGVELPRVPLSRRRYLTHEQVAQLAAACGDEGLVILVLAYTGIRWGELAAIRVREVAPGVRRIHIAESAADVNGEVVFGPPKSHADRWVAVPASLRPLIAERMAGKAPEDLVFTAPRGGVLRVQNWRRDTPFDRAAEALGVPGLVPHELRHTAASLAIQAGANVKDVQQMLGHASAAMTLDRYGHLWDDSVDRVADLLNAVMLRARASSDPSVSPASVSQLPKKEPSP